MPGEGHLFVVLSAVLTFRHIRFGIGRLALMPQRTTPGLAYLTPPSPLVVFLLNLEPIITYLRVAEQRDIRRTAIKRRQ
jgi:hypothetical protein